MTNLHRTDEKQHPIIRALLGSLQLALVVGVLVAALIINRVLVATSDSDAPPPSDVRAALVEVIKPRLTNEVLFLSETGTVEPRTELAISPQVGGRVVSVAPNFAAGGAFEAGDTLFTIDQDDYRLRLRQAEADLRAAQSSLQLEQAEADSAVREWNLINSGEDVPPLVARLPQLAQATASVDVAKASVDDARLSLKRTEFSLPFAGRVLATSIEPGLTVAANQSYGTVYSDAGVEVTIGLSPSDLELIEPALGRRAIVTGRIGGRGRDVEATIVRVDGALDPRSRLVDVVLALSEPSAFLPGSFISTRIEGRTLEGVLLVPPEAVSAAGRIWVADNNTLSRRYANVTVRTEDYVLIEALDIADGIVTTPPSGAREGQSIRLLESPGVSTAEVRE